MSDFSSDQNGTSKPKRKWDPIAVSGTVTLVIFGGIYVALTLANAFFKTADLPLGRALIIWGIGLSLIPIAVLAYVLMVQNQRRRLTALRERFPDALVISMNRPQELKQNLKFLRYTGKRLGERFVFVIRDGQLEFWMGSSNPELRFSYPAALVETVGVGLATVTRPICAVWLDVTYPGDPEGVGIALSPSFEGWRLPFSRLNQEDIEVVAEEIRDRIEVEEKRALPPLRHY